MAHAEYREITCKTALNRVKGMPFRWSLNPYRGCVHGCTYCYARSTHRYFNLGAGADFTGIILVKTNLPDVLAGELARRTWRRDVVAVGSATDPYQPAEARYRLTRRSLELLARFRTPASLVTKGTLILRDLDVLVELARGPGATVFVSVPTVDHDLWRRSEPGTPPPLQRLRAMERLVAAGINAGVLMAPLLPGLSAGREQVERTVAAAADHGAKFVGANVLRLDSDMRGEYFDFLEREYPDLLAGYRRLYPGAYAIKRYRDRLDERVRAVKEAAGYRKAGPEDAGQPPEPRQLPLLPVVP